MNEFQNWLADLDLQTLTNELKEEIIEKASDLYHIAHAEGYGEAKSEIIDHIMYKM